LRASAWTLCAAVVLPAIAADGCFASNRQSGKAKDTGGESSPGDDAVRPGEDGTGPGEDGTSPGEDPGGPGEDPGGPGKDDGPELPPPCPTFSIASFAVDGGVRWARVGEEVKVSAVIASAGEQPSVSVTAAPGVDGSQFEDLGGGKARLVLTDPPLRHRTTEVTFTLTVSSGGCERTRTAAVRLLGNVWVADYSEGVVQVFRSDGTYLAQGVPSGYLSQPWSLMELPGDRIVIGNRNKKAAEVYDLDGNHLFPFVTEDAMGQNVYSVYGAYTMLIHAPDGRVWVGGPREKVIVHDTDGKYLKTLELGFQSPSVESMIQLADGNVVYASGSSIDWYLILIDDKAEEIGRWGKNPQFPLQVEALAHAPDGKVLVTGQPSWDGKGFVALLKQSGSLIAHSDPLPFRPERGLAALGDRVLAYKGDQAGIALLGADLKVEAETWNGLEGNWSAILVLGGF